MPLFTSSPPPTSDATATVSGKILLAGALRPYLLAGATLSAALARRGYERGMKYWTSDPSGSNLVEIGTWQDINGGGGNGTNVPTVAGDGGGAHGYTTAATGSDRKGRTTNAGGLSTQRRFGLEFYAKFSLTTITDLRFFTGLIVGSTGWTAGSDTPADNYMALRYSSGALGGNFAFATDNASGSPTVVDTGVPMVLATVYQVLVEIPQGGSLPIFTLFNAQDAILAGPTEIATTLPTNTSVHQAAMQHQEKVATAKEMNMRRMALGFY